jgi:phosphatidylglycerophosphatase A
MMAESEAPALPRSHPAMLIATVCGVGFSPRMPGTLGALVALPFAWLIMRSGGRLSLLVAATVVFAVGWWAAAIACRALGKDPRVIVVDEVAGQWLTLVAAPLDPWFYAAGFVLFRLFDIWKPWPVSWADQRILGGFGTMIDDTLAAVYAIIVLLIGRLVLGR